MSWKNRGIKSQKTDALNSDGKRWMPNGSSQKWRSKNSDDGYEKILFNSQAKQTYKKLASSKYNREESTKLVIENLTREL